MAEPWEILAGGLAPQRATQPETVESTTLEIMHNNSIIRVAAIGMIGTRLLCAVPLPRGGGQYLVGDGQAVDKAQFWRLWRKFGGNATWEDGTPFDPQQS